MNKQRVGKILRSGIGLLGRQWCLANSSGNGIETAKSDDGGWEAAFEGENAVGLGGLCHKINNVVEKALEGLGIGNSEGCGAECVTSAVLVLKRMAVSE